MVVVRAEVIITLAAGTLLVVVVVVEVVVVVVMAGGRMGGPSGPSGEQKMAFSLPVPSPFSSRSSQPLKLAILPYTPKRSSYNYLVLVKLDHFELVADNQATHLSTTNTPANIADENRLIEPSIAHFYGQGSSTVSLIILSKLL